MQDNIMIGGKNSFVNIKSISDILLLVLTAVYLACWILLMCFPNDWIMQLKNMSHSASLYYSFGYCLGIFLIGFILLIIYILLKFFVRWIMAWRPVPKWLNVFSKIILMFLLLSMCACILKIYSMDVLEVVSYNKKDLKFFVSTYDTCKTSILMFIGIYIPAFIIHAYKFYRKQPEE